MEIDEIPLGKAKDIGGERFGKLMALYRVKNQGKNTVWKCKCDCGSYCEARVGNLQSGHTTSCGCKNTVDLTNQRFGKLIALEPTDKRSDGKVVWKCKCDCGNYYEVSSSSLQRGDTTSCGCKTTAVDLTNQRFGKLIALEPTDKRGNGSVVWKCKCDCGNYCEVSGRSLQTGDTSSCGCLSSKGEQKISEFLQNLEIPFESQKTFDTCRNPKTNALFRFDFFIDNKTLLEFDGEQHFKPVDFFGGEEQFQVQQEADNFKTNWCKENNIPLIRIPYYDLDNLTSEKLKEIIYGRD